MIRVYKHGIGVLILIVIIFIMGLGGAWIYLNEAVSHQSDFKLIIGLTAPVCGVYFLLIAFWAKYILSEDGIRLEIGNLISSRELKWHEIYRIAYDPGGLGICVYHIMPNIPWGKSISPSSFVKDHRELLAEIAERAPQAILDEEIKKLIEEYKKSR